MRILHSRARIAVMTLAMVVMACAANAQAELKIPYDQIPADAFSAVAQLRAKPGKEEELRAAMQPLIASVRNERANLIYFLQEDRKTLGHFIVYLVYPTEADFDAHNATPHVKEFFAKLPDLVEGDVQVTRMRVMR